MSLRRPGAPADLGGLFEFGPLEREQTIRFRNESSGLINTLPREPDKLAYFESVLSSPDRTLSRKIRVTDVGEDTGGSATGLSATDAWGRAAVGDTR
jgi:hypothetical protein